MAEPRERTQQEGALGAAGGCSEPETGITRVFQVLGKRWTGLVLAALMNGPGHFAQIRRAVPGISERMLSDRLTELASLGLVVRTVEEGPPLRVSYTLTETGLALRPAMAELTRWADEHLPGEAPNCPEEFRA
ncbi:HxlR family transcriptional regulator [Streptomyces sp. Amel2xB2]|uniref:Transcriptional regulator n=1 Tax=Streptomyces nanshensis TaxID=518642 RepID=A0A1E7LBJ9_9ACTN|nr:MULTISPECIES: helix-turn-helix domain-containing protein [Streptomyces]OEV13538.1 transcriptional regulator [Streptomyces nanshensis]RAJ66577.1 HxlR family transcriptional regulator [Streptomyces sp. Amel2xB2]